MKIYNFIKQGILNVWVFIALCFLCLFFSFAIFKADSHAYNEDTNEYVVAANEALQPILEKEDILASIYLVRSYDVKAEADANSATVRTVQSGQLVYIVGVDMDEDYQVWSKVLVVNEDEQTLGYVLRDNLACSNLRFLEWEAEYGMCPDYWNGSMNVMAIGDDEGNNAEIPAKDLYKDIKLFPESYQAALISIKQKHPNWQFVAVNTELDFSSSIAKQVGNKSWVSGGIYASFCEGPTGQKNWYYASPETIEFYMDPRNALTEERIFQFEQLTFNPEVHTESSLRTFLQGTFMEYGKFVPGLDQYAENGYSKYIMAFCNLNDPDHSKYINLSPYYIAARIIQEQGKNGSVMISGTVPGYEGYYNYFNIGASGNSDEDIIRSGMAYAKSQDWSNGYFALLGGVEFIYKGYVGRGQDTLYSQKFDYISASKFSHQYMQNITAPTTEGTSTYSMYKKCENFETVPFVFKIPVYNNMPETPLPKPITTTKFILTLPSDYVSNKVSNTPDVWIDGVKKSSVSRNGYLVIDTGCNNAKVALINKYGSDGFESGMYVWFIDYSNGAYKVTREAELDDLLTYWGFSIRAIDPNGIRFKSGINNNIKNKLLSTGVDGYKLTEYGTLVTFVDKAKIDDGTREFIKGPSHVACGVSYGAKTDYKEKISEEKDGISMFTAVFTGLEKSEYKDVFNFRCYAIVSKDGTDRIIYGPYYGKDMYGIAKRALASNQYAPGNYVYEYLSKIVYDADHLDDKE